MSLPNPRYATPDELLKALVSAEKDHWRRCDAHSSRHRREALRAALAGGCSVHILAEVLAVEPSDILAWTGPAPNTRFDTSTR